MKYRTVIELICDAGDRDEAINLAGDYLKGDVDFGVEMQCKAGSLWGYRTARYAVSSAIVLLVFASFLLKVTPISMETDEGGRSRIGFADTYTVMPELKTQSDDDFKQDWEQRKDAAILEYLKK